MALSSNGSFTSRLPCQYQRQFQSDTACWVRINSIDEDGSIWVMFVSEEQIMEVVSQALNDIDNRQQASNIMLHQVVSALNVDNTWYRAIVEALQPGIQVRFIDFGDTLVVSEENLAPLPATLSVITPLAMKVQLSSDSNVTPIVGAPLYVKHVGFKSGTAVVQVVQPPVAIMTPDSTETILQMTPAVTEPDNGQTDDCELDPTSLQTGLPMSSSENQLESSEADGEILCSTLTVPPPTAFSTESQSLTNVLQSVEGNQEALSLNLNATSVELQEISSQRSIAPPESGSSEVSPCASSVNFEENKSVGSEVPSPPCASSESFKEHTVDESFVEPSSTILECQSPSQCDGKSKNSKEGILSDLDPPRDCHLEQDVSASPSSCNSAEATSTSKEEELDKLLKTIPEIQSSESESSSLVNQDFTKLDASSQGKPEKSSLLSELDQYPDIRGGYGQKTYAAHASSNGSINKSSFDHSVPSPRIITKGRNSPSARPLRSQEVYQPPCASRSVPSKGNSQTLNTKAPSQRTSGSSIPQDFKAILEFELSIIREQNRLQMLQLQKKMEQNFGNQIRAMKDETMKRLDAIRNELNSRLSVVNDSVVHKMADIYSDLTMLKNDQEINRPANTSPSFRASAHSPTNYQQQRPMLKNDQEINRPANASPSFRASAHSPTNYQQQRPKSAQGQHFMGSSASMLSSTEVSSQQNTHHHPRDYRNERSSQGNSQFDSQNHQSCQVSNNFHEKANNALDVSSGFPNRLMETRKEKMIEKDTRFYQPYQHNSRNPGSDNYQDNQQDKHSSFPVGQFNPNSYPKMDYFDPNKTGLENDAENGGNKSGGSIICVNNLVSEKINPDLLFNLFGTCGNIQRVKIIQNDKGRAYIELGDPAQAEAAVRLLNRAPLMGQKLHVTPCSFGRLALTRQDFEANLAKDYTKPILQNLNRFKNFKWDAQKLHPPSNKLMITNVLNSVTDEKLREEFTKRGFEIQHIASQLCPKGEKKILHVTMSSIEEAVTALTVMHLQELADWMRMRISFGRNDRFLER